jgi:TRAP-type mannitol/chloroaromatic compound transport system permease small subunit
MKITIAILEKFINAIGYICAALMLLMLFTVFYDVLSRYLFNSVSIGMQELEWHFFAAMFMFGIGYTLKEDGHVRVDVFFDKMSPRKQAWIDLIGSLFFALPIAILILYYGISYAHDSYVMNEGSGDPGGLPNRWIIRAVIPASAGFLILSIFYVVLVRVEVLLGMIEPPKHKGVEL